MTSEQLSTVDLFTAQARETGARVVVEDTATPSGPVVLVSEHFTGYACDSFLWRVAPDGTAELID
jgi:hypothetical protein